MSALLEGDDPGAEEQEHRLPDSLQEFALEAELPPADVKMLATIRYRGRAPRNKDDWRFLYESIRRSVQS